MIHSNPFSLHPWPQAILHIDGDAFFASCEQSLHPEYKGKPVITGQERNIVASLSYEAKACGVRRGCAVWEARKICPELIVVPSDYETYSLISKRMFSIMRTFTPLVEESSIDEGYADLKGLRRVYRMGYDAIARKIQNAIEGELGLSVSMGLSLTKTLAKLAAKYKKPSGFTVVKGYTIHEFLQNILVSDVCGIGPNTTALLEKHGVRNAYQYACKPEGWIKKLLGKIGIELWHELRGQQMYFLNDDAKVSYQSVSKTKTFTPPSDSYEYLRAQLFRNAESACIKIRRYRLRAKKVCAYLRKHTFRTQCAECELNRATASPQELFPFIEKMLALVYEKGVVYRATGITLSKIEADGAQQYDLFESPVKMIHLRELAYNIDAINKRYGKHTVFAATGLFLRRREEGDPELFGRCARPQRKKELLKGETARRRIRIPLWHVKV